MIHGWDNFYVIIGSAAAGLTGLTFIALTLVAQRLPSTEGEALKAFATPNLVLFSTVLLVAGIVTMPRHTLGSLAVALATIGTFGIAYFVRVTLVARRQNEYQPVWEDWLWYSILPWIGFTILFVSGLALFGRPEGALYGVATGALLLLFTGIHNTWDGAVWLIKEGRPPI